MKLASLLGQAKKAVDKRGGTDALKQDLQQLQTIATGEGTISEKAKKAGAALKDPGAAGRSAPDPAAERVSGTPSPTASESSPEPVEPAPGPTPPGP